MGGRVVCSSGPRSHFTAAELAGGAGPAGRGGCISGMGGAQAHDRCAPSAPVLLAGKRTPCSLWRGAGLGAMVWALRVSELSALCLLVIKWNLRGLCM